MKDVETGKQAAISEQSNVINSFIEAFTLLSKVERVKMPRFYIGTTEVITQEEACVMLARAAKVCGMYKEADTENSEYNLNYSNVSDWAEDGVRFCIEDEIINASDMHPKEYITREEIAQMLFNMLKNSELI